MSWWRRACRPEPCPTRLDLIGQRFAWLESEFGCRSRESVDQTMFSRVVWSNDAVDLCVSIDARDGASVAFFRASARAGGRRYDLYGVRFLREHGTLEGIRQESRARRLPDDWGRQLDLLAADLRTDGAEVLRGDLALLDRLDDELRRLYPETLRPF